MYDQNQREVFANNLNMLMKSRGVDQIDIVGKLGITASTVSDWVRGKKYPRVDAMQNLANFFGVRISDLTNDGSSVEVNTQQLDEDEQELIAIFRRLNRRNKHEMMSKAYEFERKNR